MPGVDSGGAEIYYEITGAGDPLVLIMGLGADSRGWAMQTTALAEHYRLILIDNRGVGKSSVAPPPYTTKQMAADALAIMNDAGIERAPLKVVTGGDVEENAERLTSLLAGRTRGPEQDIVALNTAALLLTAGKAATLREGAELARDALKSGRAGQALDRFVEASRA